MKLSVIIVNYNVKYFLEQAIKSAVGAAAYCHKQSEQWQVDVWIVDNQSVDGSVAFVREQFPEVKLIANAKNVGFSTANNQAIRASKGEHVLLLNPDTIVPEDCFQKVIQFMEDHPDAGGLGVRMVDGKGVFLPESKRGLPTPMVSLYKMTGLSKLFRSSQKFNKYHLGFLDEMETHEVDILSGAFMMMRREALDKVGLLDETFFMYGEDIDMSYRIIKGGYKNYYSPDPTIVHYKGESTKKGSLNYVRVFYNAMIIFARKHFQEGQDGWYTRCIRLGVYLRAAMSVSFGFLKRIAPYLFDFMLIVGGLLMIKYFWETNVKQAVNRSYYSSAYLYFNVPLYTGIWLVSSYFSGAYDQPWRIGKLIRGLLVGTVLISAVYGFLPEEYRFSRSMIVLGAFSAIALLSLWRMLYHMWNNKSLEFNWNSNRKLAIVGEIDEVERVRLLLGQTRMEHEYVGYIQCGNALDDSRALGHFQKLDELIQIFKLEEVVLCHRDLGSARIIDAMLEYGQKVQIRTIAENGESIIGSHSKNTAGDLYALDLNLNINKPGHRRNKRVFDFLSSFGILLLSPILWLFVRGKFHLISNAVKVLFGQLSWVGYGDEELEGLALKPSVLTPADEFPGSVFDGNTLKRLMQIYAREYSVYHDLNILFKGFRDSGRPTGNKGAKTSEELSANSR